MAKSSFWDDLGNTLTRKAKGLSSRAENLYEIQKIRNKLSAQERMTEKLMMDIGKMIYTRYEQGDAVDGETGAICEEISQHMLEADHYRDAIAASKGEKFCPACHKAVMREASFCPYCGAACPTAELEEKAADVIEQADEELEEAAEAEVTEVPETEAEADPEETVEASEVVETAETAEASETETSGSDPELEEERTEVGSAETEEPAADPENTETIEEKTE
ncbi:zinc ribbon domain-containing protein [Blautia massiliensis (ex Liu et al. 2021)]|uniref:zinc ribbon domain-containing protein n=1 Tax=Blautia massiliensis (ex Liu et al. 2021) TaxID=3062492 RepID=UPI003F895179